MLYPAQAVELFNHQASHLSRDQELARRLHLRASTRPRRAPFLNQLCQLRYSPVVRDMATPAAKPVAAPVPRDELDDLFDYNVTLDDVFRDVDTNMHAPTAPRATAIPSRTKKDSHKVDSLGIDEEVKVQRKRTPIPKLDEERLLSQAGIPKLRRITKERLRFKGKGHEVRPSSWFGLGSLAEADFVGRAVVFGCCEAAAALPALARRAVPAREIRGWAVYD